MKLLPVYTEKSLNEAKNGRYTFWVDKNADKPSIKKEMEKVFGVHVVSIKTINYQSGTKRNMRGRKVSIKPAKKAIITLRDKDKLDLFEEEKKWEN